MFALSLCIALCCTHPANQQSNLTTKHTPLIEKICYEDIRSFSQAESNEISPPPDPLETFLILGLMIIAAIILQNPEQHGNQKE